MAKSRDVNKDALLRRLRARLDRKSRGATADADAQFRAQMDIYARFRAALFTNGDSTNVQALDAVAVAVLADDVAVPAELSRAVVVLPPPSAMTVETPPPHDLFAPAASVTRTPKRPAAKGAVDRKSPPAKKRRNTKGTDDDADLSMLELPDDCPPEIRRDLSRLFKEAAAQGKAPFRVAYPWVGQRAWYDPQEHPDMYLAHWRYWMRFRPTFFNCALYAPTDSSEARRKKKSDAIQGRLILISMNVMTFGYYGFLGLYEDGAHDMLMWLGGKAARHSVAAKAKAGSVVTSQTDLATLYRTDRARYDRILANALDPYHIDEEGYKSIPELLEQTNALDPTRKPHLRLNDEALARIVFDVNSGPPPTTAWVGNKSSGPWKVLLSNRRIHEVQVYIAKKLKKGTYEVPGEEKPFKPKEQGDADSDFLDDEDMFTTLAPTPPVEGGYPAGSSDDEDAEELEEKLPADEAPDEDDEDPEDPPDQGGEGEPSDEPPAKSKGSDSSASATKSK